VFDGALESGFQFFLAGGEEGGEEEHGGKRLRVEN
jgi:hypothetical protein